MPFGAGTYGEMAVKWETMSGPNGYNWMVEDDGVPQTYHEAKKEAKKTAKEGAERMGKILRIYDKKGKEIKKYDYTANSGGSGGGIAEGPGLDNEISGSFDEFYGVDK